MKVIYYEQSLIIYIKFFIQELHTFTKLYLEYKIMKNSNDFSYIIYFR